MMSASQAGIAGEFDVIVVGAGFGGLYALHRFRQQGFTVIGFEGADNVGGVWQHNRYPGARVDVDSFDYCYYFSPELYNDWTWSERFAAQPEVLRYLEHVAQRFDLTPLIRLSTWVETATWRPEMSQWEVSTSAGDVWRAQFLVLATGNLSEARQPDFQGLDNFAGEWFQTAHWPKCEVTFANKRVAVVGTGSSGIQCIPVIAQTAKQVSVLQRTPNFSVPAQNGPADPAVVDRIRARVLEEREYLMSTGGTHLVNLAQLKSGQPIGSGPARRPASDFSDAEQQALLERQWNEGGHGMAFVFSDQGVNAASNTIVSEFVRQKIRQIVENPELAEILCPYDHPIGSRRLCLDTDYYATFNRTNVNLVDLTADPIERIVEVGIRLQSGHIINADLIVFALGFHAFTGALDRVCIRNTEGAAPTDRWSRGPRTLLGLMTTGFPNFFFLAGPGSPATLSNLVVLNEYHVDWVANCITHMRDRNMATIEPELSGEDQWTEHVASVAAPLLRLKVPNYMVHRNEDGTGVFIPFAGGIGLYRKEADRIAASGYTGFAMRPQGASSKFAMSNATP